MMRRHVRKRIGAVCQIIFLIAMFRWEGWYGNLIPIPWVPAIILSLLVTVLTLRFMVFLDRHL